MKIYNEILSKTVKGKKMLAVLVDPDRITEHSCREILEKSEAAQIDFFFVGSSLITENNFDNCLSILRESEIPVVLFPGNTLQINNNADALLFLSLISGRNPEMLIGRHVIAAPLLKRTLLEIIPTGYLLIDSGSPTSVSYMSGTVPIPHDKDEIAACTAMAGEMLGLKIIYLDAGSGARFKINASMIEAVRKSVSIPIIVGGGIRTPEQAYEAYNAGADLVVIGNVLEKDPSLIADFGTLAHSLQSH
jgi:putative glycerol-1-phosphate prenyltransferase